ncbi:MAG: AzlD domain-containing protein [Desulfonatronovibrionaceae bacterium]
MDQKVVFWTIVGMVVVTYIPRVLPIATLSSRSLAPWLVRWLELVPASVLAALLAPAILVENGELNVSAANPFVWASLFTLALARITGSFVGSILAGMGVVAFLRYFVF